MVDYMTMMLILLLENYYSTMDMLILPRKGYQMYTMFAAYSFWAGIFIVPHLLRQGHGFGNEGLCNVDAYHD